jgi:hypothetical protein
VTAVPAVQSNSNIDDVTLELWLLGLCCGNRYACLVVIRQIVAVTIEGHVSCFVFMEAVLHPCCNDIAQNSAVSSSHGV